MNIWIYAAEELVQKPWRWDCLAHSSNSFLQDWGNVHWYYWVDSVWVITELQQWERGAALRREACSLQLHQGEMMNKTATGAEVELRQCPRWKDSKLGVFGENLNLTAKVKKKLFLMGVVLCLKWATNNKMGERILFCYQQEFANASQLHLFLVVQNENNPIIHHT